MINNRQNGRRRGRGGQQRVGGGNSGRPESGNKIDSRARGNASQLHEKYKALAGDAQRQGDRVNTEYYLQFADHYFRVLAESRPRFEEQQVRARAQDFDDEFDGDGEDFGLEGEAGQPDQYQPRADDRQRPDVRNEGRQDGRPQENRQQDRHPQDRQYQDRQYQDRQYQDRQYQDRQGQPSRQDARPDDHPRRDDRPRSDRQDGRPERPRPEQFRSEAPRADQPRPEERVAQGRPRRDGAPDQRPRDERLSRIEQSPERIPDQAAAVGSADPVSVVADETPVTPLPEVREASTVRAADMDAPMPRRRGRPPKVRPEEAPGASEPSGLDADRLPPSLSVSASAEPEAGEPAEKPRRRRRVAAEPVEAGSTN